MQKAPTTLRAHIKGFPQPDQLFLRGPIKKGLPLERTIYLIGIETPKLGNSKELDQPFAFEAREFLRKSYNTKEIEFRIECKIPGK